MKSKSEYSCLQQQQYNMKEHSDNIFRTNESTTYVV